MGRWVLPRRLLARCVLNVEGIPDLVDWCMIKTDDLTWCAAVLSLRVFLPTRVRDDEAAK